MNKMDLCAYCPEVAERPAGRTLLIVITLFGVGVLAIANSLRDAENLSTLLLTIGIVLLAFGIIKLIRPSRKIYYVATGEVVRRHIEGHEQESKERVVAACREGNFGQIAALAAKNSSTPLVSVTYTTPSGSLRIGQVLNYVPYEYQPLMEPVIYKAK